jgi:hypothetical protein
MFLKHHDQSVSIDLSHELRDPQDWKVGILRSFEYPLNITTLAIEPISGLLAFGMAHHPQVQSELIWLCHPYKALLTA